MLHIASAYCTCILHPACYRLHVTYCTCMLHTACYYTAYTCILHIVPADTTCVLHATVDCSSTRTLGGRAAVLHLPMELVEVHLPMEHGREMFRVMCEGQRATPPERPGNKMLEQPRPKSRDSVRETTTFSAYARDKPVWPLGRLGRRSLPPPAQALGYVI